MENHIGILHDDILLLIFDLVLERVPENGDFCLYRPNSRHLIWRLMRVCRRWASVLLSWSPAWTYVTKSSALARSGESQLLDVYLDNPDPEVLHTVVAGCRERLRQLHLFFDAVPQFRISVNVSSSTIRSFTLAVPQRYGGAVEVIGLEPDEMPSLKKLRMIGTDVAGLVFRDLTHLCVEGCRVDQGALVEVLRLNIGLRELVVAGADFTQTVVNGVLPVEMPYLRWLYLDKMVAEMLVYLRLGSRFALQLRNLGAYVSVDVPHTSAPALEKLRIRRTANDVTYDITTSSDDHCIYQRVNGFEMCLQALGADRIWFGFIQELWIKDWQKEPPFEWKRWKHVLECMDALLRIYVQGGTCKCLLGPLCMPHRTTGGLVCPRLQQMVLVQTTAHSKRLLEMVKLRHQLGTPLRLLELAWPLMEGEIPVAKFREYVDEVYILTVGPVRGMSIPKEYRENRHDRWIEL